MSRGGRQGSFRFPNLPAMRFFKNPNDARGLPYMMSASEGGGVHGKANVVREVV